MKKLLGILFVLALALVAPLVSAADFSFSDIEVNGENVMDGTVLYVERGETLDIRAVVKATANIQDVRVSAHIGGYEYGTVETDSQIMKIDSGSSRIVNLQLKVPDDMDASDDVTLYLKAYNDDSVDVEITLRLQEKRHDVRLFDVIINPGLSVRDYLSVSAVVENMGDCVDIDSCEAEKNVIVEASIPALGISVRDSIDKLYPETLEDDSDESARDSTAKVNLPIIDLSNAPAGEYELRVRAYYNRKNDFSEKKYTLVVEKGPVTDLILNADATSKNIVEGQAVEYKISVANLGKNDRTFLINVEGVSTFGSANVEPRMITVRAGSTQDVKLTLTAKENIQGSNLFSVKLLENGQLVQELNLEAKVGEDDSLATFKTGLQVGFVILLVILIILGIIVALSRGKSNGNIEVPTPSRKEEEKPQTYY